MKTPSSPESTFPETTYVKSACAGPEPALRWSRSSSNGFVTRSNSSRWAGRERGGGRTSDRTKR
jgi:hypothetical protein